MGQVTGAFKSDPPPMPDYVGAAKQQGTENINAAIATFLLNNANQVTPYGTKSVNQTGSFTLPGPNGKPSKTVIPLFEQSIDFTPEGQKLFDQQNRISNQVGDLAESGLSNVQKSFSTPFGMDNVNQLTDKAQAAILSRLEPMLEKNRAAKEASLITRGHNPQNESYSAQMEQLGQQENDARTQAVLHALNYAPQLMGQEMAIRNQPLNELNALRSGSQVVNPTFSNMSPTAVTAAPLFQSVQAEGQHGIDLYNTQAMQEANFIGGLFGLGKAALGGK